MEKEDCLKQRTASISVEPYLATYAQKKFDIDPKTGGIKIPDKFNLYHAVWHAMAKWPLERWHIGVKRRVDNPQGNLLIHLPDCREGGVRKNPLYWNYISPRSARVINRDLKLLFDWEFHHYVEILLEYHPDITKKEAIARFAKKYALGIDTEDALLKNFQRHEKAVRIFLGLKKNKTSENKVKSTGLSPTDLSVPSGLAYARHDGDDLCRSKDALRVAITQGLQLLGESGVDCNPVL